MKLSKTARVILLLILVFFVVVISGPRAVDSSIDPIIEPLNVSINDLDHFIQEKESGVKNLKQDNHARVIWSNDTLKTKTEWSIVYLHGFSASQGEGEPIHREFARKYGYNMYLSRLYGHGISDLDAMKDMKASSLVESAKEAIAIGKLLGERVLVMSTSTGGTLSLYLSSENPDLIDAMILYSPNIDLVTKQTRIMTYPWGLSLSETINGGNTIAFPAESPYDSLYWTKAYRLEGLAALQDLMNKTMNAKTFSGVDKPVFMGYYYKDEDNQDPVVSVEAMLNMYSDLATPDNLKRKVAFPNVGRHVIASKYKSEDWESVREETYRFAEEVLGFRSVN